MATPALTGQIIDYKGHSVPLQYDKQKSSYYVTINGVRYEVDWNCIHNSKIAEVKEDIQEQADNHQKWIDYYHNMIACANEKISAAKAAIKKATDQMAQILNGANVDDSSNLEASQQKEYSACQQQVSDNKSIDRRAGNDIIYAANRASDENFHKHIFDLQVIMCDHLENSTMA